jgi:hypothetical protein
VHETGAGKKREDDGPEDVDVTETRFLLGQVGRKAMIGLRNDGCLSRIGSLNDWEQ